MSSQMSGDRRRRPGKRARWVVALGAALAALVVVAGLAELGLRAVEWYTLSVRDAPAGEQGVQTVLCVGDSWTYGLESGDPAKYSYPARLQGLLDDDAGAGRFAVVNRGKPGLDSHALADSMPEYLKQFKPATVVVLVGATNYFGVQSFGLGEAANQPTSDGYLGAVESLKVVRVARMLFRPRWKRRPDNQQRSFTRQFIDKVRADLLSDMDKDDDSGLDPVFTRGCTDASPKAMAALRQKLTSVLSSGMWAVEKELAPHRSCQPALIVGAEVCLAADDWRCALKIANRALTLDDQQPRALTVWAWAHRKLHGSWHKTARERLEELGSAFPDYNRGQRLLSLTLLEQEKEICALKNILVGVVKSCAGCRWARRALRTVAAEVDLPAGRLLWDDLDDMLSLARRSGARMMLINYPPSDIDICGQMPRDVITRFGASRGLPVVDIGDVLGPMASNKKLTFYSALDGHPNRAGYERIARAVLKRMKAEGWVAAPSTK